MRYCTALIITCCLFTSYSCTKNTAPSTLPANDTTPLKKVAAFKTGASVVVPLLQNDSLYRNTVLHEYSSITTANTLKWFAVHPSEKFI